MHARYQHDILALFRTSTNDTIAHAATVTATAINGTTAGLTAARLQTPERIQSLQLPGVRETSSALLTLSASLRALASSSGHRLLQVISMPIMCVRIRIVLFFCLAHAYRGAYRARCESLRYGVAAP